MPDIDLLVWKEVLANEFGFSLAQLDDDSAIHEGLAAFLNHKEKTA